MALKHNHLRIADLLLANVKDWKALRIFVKPSAKLKTY